MTTRQNSPALAWLLGLSVFAAAVWYAFRHSPVPLLILLTLASAQVSIHVGQQSVERYGRRVPVTEMLALARQGDRAMLLGGLCGYLMLIFCLAAAYFAF